MALILFEDENTKRLTPAALTRPAMTISCGGYTLAELLGELKMPARSIVRPHLLPFVAADPETTGSVPDGFDLLVNGRLVPSLSSLQKIRKWITDGRPGIVTTGAATVAALVAGATPRLPASAKLEDVPRYLDEVSLKQVDIDLPLLEYPHDIIRYHLELLDKSLAHRIAQGGYHEADDRVFLAAGAQLGPYVATDTSDGPIVLEAGATVESHSYLRGPIHLGQDTRVVNHASIKSHVTAGQGSKLGGEISCSIIEPYSNKAHYGFLGHSYLGSWVNLGAGTTNSNLKNTYGTINMQYDQHRVATDMQFMGCIVGDYTKTAINTSIFTGKTIGACSMLYGFVTENVPSFVNYARQFGKCSEVSIDAATTMQARMFARRNLEHHDSDAQLLAELHARTADERRQFDGNLVEGPLLF